MARKRKNEERDERDIKVHVEGELLKALEKQAKRDFRNPNQQILYILNQYLLEGITMASEVESVAADTVKTNSEVVNNVVAVKSKEYDVGPVVNSTEYNEKTDSDETVAMGSEVVISDNTEANEYETSNLSSKIYGF